MKRYLPAALVLAVTVNLAIAVGAPPKKTLTLATNPDPVVFGRSVALGGRLTGSNKAGKTIQVQADAFPYENNFKNVASAVAGTNGKWSASHKPSVNTRYRARQ